MRTFLTFAWVLLQVALALLAMESPAEAYTPSESSRITLDQAWFYRWGDPPSDGQYPPLWARQESEQKGWEPIKTLANPPGRENQEVLWLKVELPQGPAANASLYLPGVDQVFEVFLNGRSLYHYGRKRKGGEIIAAYPFHVIPLPADYARKPLFFRIQSRHVNIGLIGTPVISTEGDHLTAIVQRDIVRLFVGALLVTLAVAVSFLFMRKRGERAYLGFAWLAMAMGSYTIMRTEIKYLFTDRAATLLWIEIASMYATPAGVAFFVTAIFGPGPRRMVDYVWKGLVIFPLLLLALAGLGVLTLLQTLMPFQIGFLLVLPVGFIPPYKAMLRGDREGLYFVVGIAAFFVAAVVDVLMAVDLIPRLSMGVTHLGVAFFVGCLVAILGRRFVEVHNKIARLKTSLEHILAGTKEMATARESVAAAGKAIHYILREVSLETTTTATLVLCDRNDKEGGNGRAAVLVREGVRLEVAELGEPGEIKSFFPEVSEDKFDRTHLTIDRSVHVPLVWGHKNVGYLELTQYKFETIREEEAHFINTLASSLAISLENINFLAETHDKAMLEAEINAARAVQEALLPHYSEFPGVDIGAYYQPTSKTGGDWYGYFYDSVRHRFDFYIGDVTGHGIPSALLTGVACGSVYSAEEASLLAGAGLQEAASHDEHLSRLVNVVNKIILQAGQQRLLMTMLFASLDLETGELIYVSAGHNPAFLRKVSEQKARILHGRGNRLGYSETPEFTVKKAQLDPGDIVFLYTDGLIENTGPGGKLLTDKKVRELVTAHSEVSAMQEAILSAGRGIWQDQPGADDVTMLVFRWREKVTRAEVLAHLEQKRLERQGKDAFQGKPDKIWQTISTTQEVPAAVPPPPPEAPTGSD